MSELAQKVKTSVDRIKSFASLTENFADDGTNGYYLAFSGGKDSVAVKALMDGRFVEHVGRPRLVLGRR